MNWKLFCAVWAAALFGAVAVIPLSLTLQGDLLQSAEIPFPLPVLLLISLLQSAVMLAVVTFVGLKLAPRVALQLPLFEALVNKGERPDAWLSKAVIAAGIGIVGALLVLGLEYFYFLPAMTAAEIGFPEFAHAPAWQGLLASFYGGITEEVLMRLFLMTVIVWVGSLLTRSSADSIPAYIYWIGILFAAVAFGVGHLPATAALGVPLNGLVISRALLLNGIIGVLAGWLYWKRGLGYAMIAHFAADIVLHVLT